MRFDLDGVNVNTRPVINEFIRHWLKVHTGEMWTANTMLEFVRDVEIMCKSLGYSIELKREDDKLMVIVYETV